MTWAQLVGTLLAAIVSALTIGAFMWKIMSRIADRSFDDSVMASLERNPANYRAYHSKVFAPELDRGRRTADIASGLVRDIAEHGHKLADHADEFRRFRVEYTGHQELLITIPAAVTHLDQTMKELRGTIYDMHETVIRSREDIAALKATRA